MSRKIYVANVLILLLMLLLVGDGRAVAVAQGFGAPSTSPMPAAVAPSLQPGAAPMTQMAPVPPRSSFTTPDPPSAFLGNPTFDPYGAGATPGTFQPALPNQPAVPPVPPMPGSAALGSIFGGNSGSTAGFGGGPAPLGYGVAGAAPQVPAPGYPATVYPNAGPPVLFPGGGYGVGTAPGGYYNPVEEFGFPAAIKFCQGPRIQHAFVGGGDGPDELGMNETDVSLAFAFPNFLYSGQPVYVLPSFSVIAFDGPAGRSADLPGSVYEAFLDVGWQTDPNQMLGVETGLRVGAFTDFDTFNSDSVRVMGQALAKFRVTPRATVKAGVIYVDRNKIDWIPAGGILYQPTPYSRWDLYFPEPKVSRYVTTLGTHDLWAYVAGEYGGGSWTVTRTSGEEESIDVNDIRVLFGMEWGRSDLIRSGRRTGFAEAGVVFAREVLYTRNRQDDFDPNTTFVIRLGLGY